MWPTETTRYKANLLSFIRWRLLTAENVFGFEFDPNKCETAGVCPYLCWAPGVFENKICLKTENWMVRKTVVCYNWVKAVIRYNRVIFFPPLWIWALIIVELHKSTLSLVFLWGTAPPSVEMFVHYRNEELARPDCDSYSTCVNNWWFSLTLCLYPSMTLFYLLFLHNLSPSNCVEMVLLKV